VRHFLFGYHAKRENWTGYCEVWAGVVLVLLRCRGDRRQLGMGVFGVVVLGIKRLLRLRMAARAVSLRV
jgi:hypothetical protein